MDGMQMTMRRRAPYKWPFASPEGEGSRKRCDCRSWRVELFGALKAEGGTHTLGGQCHLVNSAAFGAV